MTQRTPITITMLDALSRLPLKSEKGEYGEFSYNTIQALIRRGLADGYGGTGPGGRPKKVRITYQGKKALEKYMVE